MCVHRADQRFQRGGKNVVFMVYAFEQDRLVASLCLLLGRLFTGATLCGHRSRSVVHLNPIQVGSIPVIEEKRSEIKYTEMPLVMITVT